MASVTINRPDLFPTGTTIGAYQATGTGQTPSSGAPPGTAKVSITTVGDSFTLAGLADSTTYILYAASPDRYLRVSTPPGSSTSTVGPVGDGDPFRFDPTRLAVFKSAIANRTTSPVTILCIGHSITEGQSVTRTTRWQNVLVDLLRTRYPTPGVTGGAGSVPPQYIAGVITNPFTITGAPTDSGSGLGARGKKFVTGQSASITMTCTGFDVSILKGSTGGTFTYTIDGSGGSQSPVNSNNASTIHFKISERGLAATSHTIVFTGPATNNLFLQDVMFYNGDEAAGIRGPVDAGHAGWAAASFLDASTGGFAYYPYRNFALPQLVIVESGGINDWGSVDTVRAAPRDFEESLRNLISGIRGLPSGVPAVGVQPSIILVEDHKRGTAGSAFRGEWDQYTDAVRRTAREDPYGITLFNSQTVLGDASNVSNPLIGADQVHPTTAGHAALAAALDALIASA